MEMNGIYNMNLPIIMTILCRFADNLIFFQDFFFFFQINKKKVTSRSDGP
jgi:hypothetical protein